jgi:anaerobic magnesium-protoporphyrin IX monomethyl ester cyclase
LRNLNRSITLKQIRESIALTKTHGIKIWAYFMLGNPGDTIETMKQTIDFAIELEPDFIQINRLSPFPGTRLHYLLNEQNHCDIWEPYIRFQTDYHDFQIHNLQFTPKQIDAIIKKAYRRFYFRLKYIWYRLKEIKSMDMFIRYVKAAFALI